MKLWDNDEDKPRLIFTKSDKQYVIRVKSGTYVCVNVEDPTPSKSSVKTDLGGKRLQLSWTAHKKLIDLYFTIHKSSTNNAIEEIAAELDKHP